jgi:hypothetical protein
MNIIDSKEENYVIDSIAHLCSRFAPHPGDPSEAHRVCIGVHERAALALTHPPLIYFVDV